VQPIGSIVGDIVFGIADRERLDPGEVSALPKLMAVGIDPGKTRCGAAIVDPKGDLQAYLNPVKEFIFANNWHGMNRLLKESLAAATKLRAYPVFVVETTNVYWKPIYWHLYNQGALVQSVNPLQTKRARGTRMRKTATDKIDARFVAKVFLMGEAHQSKFPPPQWAELRELTRLLVFFDKTVTALKNRIHTTLYQSFPEWQMAFGKKGCFSATALDLMQQELISPHRLLEISTDQLAGVIKKASRGRLSVDKAQQLQSLAAVTFGISLAQQSRSLAVSLMAQQIEFADKQIIKPLMERIQLVLSGIEHKLLTIHGLGPKTAAIFLAELGNPKWFQRTKQVVAWFGIDPSAKLSARSRRTTNHISKAGTSYGRYGMFNGAMSWMLHNPRVKQLYDAKRQMGKSHDDALCCITAKLVRTCWAIVRDNCPFDAKMLN
jgi:transposase